MFHSCRSRLHHIQLSATRSTVYRPLTAPSPQALCWYTPRKCCSILSLHEEEGREDIDVVGVVACITSSHVMSHEEAEAERQLDSVFLVDEERRLLLVNVWDSLEVSPVSCGSAYTSHIRTCAHNNN